LVLERGASVSTSLLEDRNTLIHGRMLSERRFYLSQLHAKTSHLYHAIATSQVFDLPIRAKPAYITRSE
jgi:hypothetical protein